MAVVDGKDLILGRMSSAIAKRLLNGEKIDLINAEKVVIIGSKTFALSKFKIKYGMQAKGNPIKGGPKFQRMPQKIVKKAVRGMLPCKKSRGRNALKQFKAFIGVPKEFEGKEKETIKAAEMTPKEKFVRIEEISKAFGAKW